jgi:hypothetical protein
MSPASRVESTMSSRLRGPSARISDIIARTHAILQTAALEA